MTVIGRDRYSEEMDTRRRYRLAECPRCKAKTIDEAEVACRQTQDPSGEYSCPGSSEGFDPFSVKWDATGRACVLVNRDARREARELSEWCEAQARSI